MSKNWELRDCILYTIKDLPFFGFVVSNWGKIRGAVNHLTLQVFSLLPRLPLARGGALDYIQCLFQTHLFNLIIIES